MSDDESIKISSQIEATLLDYREKVVILHGLSKDAVERDMARLKAHRNDNHLNQPNSIDNNDSSSSSDEDTDENNRKVLSLRKKKPEKTWCVFVASANQVKPPEGKSQTFHLQSTVTAS